MLKYCLPGLFYKGYLRFLKLLVRFKNEQREKRIRSVSLVKVQL